MEEKKSLEERRRMTNKKETCAALTKYLQRETPQKERILSFLQESINLTHLKMVTIQRGSNNSSSEDWKNPLVFSIWSETKGKLLIPFLYVCRA